MGRKVLSVILCIEMVLMVTLWVQEAEACPCKTCAICESCVSAQPSVSCVDANYWCFGFYGVDAMELLPCILVSQGGCASVGVPDSVRYSPTSSMPGLAPRYSGTSWSYAELVENLNVNPPIKDLYIYIDTDRLHFRFLNGVWRNSLNDGVRGPGQYKLVPAVGTGEVDVHADFAVQEQGSGLLKKYTFKGFDGQGADDGKLVLIKQAGQEIEYTLAQGLPTSATDAYGRTTTYHYTGAGYVEYIVRCSTASKLDQYGPVTKFVYDGTRIVEVWQGTPTVAQPYYNNAGHYDWKKTLFWFDGNGNLAYEVGPQGYTELPPNPTSDNIAAKAQVTYLYDAGKVKQVIGASCASCGGSDKGGVKLASVSVEDLYPGDYPNTRNTPVKQVNVRRVLQPTLGADPTEPWPISEKVQTNVQGQLIVRLKVMDNVTGSPVPVMIEKNVYSNADDDTAGRLQKTYYYEGVASDIPNATLKKVVKYEFDANGFVEYEKVSADDSAWTTKKRTIRNSSGQVTKEYADGVHFNDPTDAAYATLYTYDASTGRLTQKQEPTVTVNLDKAGGQSYRPTTNYTYTTWGDLNTVSDPTSMGTKYYYGYNDDNNTNDLLFKQTKVIVDSAEGQLNLTTLYTYTEQNGQWRLTKVKDPALKETSYTVDSRGRTTQVTSPLGYKACYTYDLNDRVTLVERKDASDHLLAKRGTTYDVFGNVLMEKEYVDATHYYATCYRRDNGGHLRKVWARVYDASFDGTNDPTGTVHGNVTEYKYQHTTDLVTEVWQGARSTTPVKVASSLYDVFGRKTKEQRWYGQGNNDHNDVDYAYDFQGRPTSMDGPGDAYTAYTYDERDLATQVDRRNGSAQGTLLACTKTYYDEASRVYKTEVVNPDHTAYVRATNYYRDKAGRLCRTADPGSHNTDQDYDTAGRLIKTTDPLGNVALYTLDPAGNRTLTTVKHKLSETPTWRTEHVFTWFDDDSRVEVVANFGKNPPPNWSPTEESADPPMPAPYNYANWPTKPTASDSNKLVTKHAYGWDGTYGQYMEVTDPAATATRSFGDLLGRTTRTVEDVGGIARTTAYAFDQLDGNDYYDSITAENGAETDQVTKYWYMDQYDGVEASRVTKVTYPDSGYVIYSFRRDGTPSERTDQRGWTTTYTCDAAGRVVQEAVAGTGLVGTTKVITAYDALGRVTDIKDNNGQQADDYSWVHYSYAWAAASAEMTVTETNYLNNNQTPIGAVTSIYNADGERTKLTYPNSRYVTFTYDNGHRLDQISDDTSPTPVVLADYDYKGGYLQDRKLNADALRLTFRDQADLDGYDAFGRMAWMRHYKASNSTDVVKLTYSHDYVGTPKYQEDLVNANADELYGTDALHRLTSFKRGNLNGNKDDITDNPLPREQTWTLQHVGNWSAAVSKTNGNDDTPYDTRTHNTVNEITAIDPQGAVGSFNVASDDAGNLKELPDRTDTTKCERYTYDYRNRLIKVEHSTNYDQQTPTWTTVVEYYHDGLNRRVQKDLASGTDVLYLYDGWRCIEEQELDGQAWEARRQFVFGGVYLDEVLILDKDTDADGNCTDSGGSTRYLYCANNNFNVMALTDKDGVVVETVKYDPYGQPTLSGTATGNPFLFQGQRYDSETGLYYFKNRDYSPVLGRFLQRDPMEYVDGANFYLAFAAMPMASKDPYGLYLPPGYEPVGPPAFRWVPRIFSDGYMCVTPTGHIYICVVVGVKTSHYRDTVSFIACVKLANQTMQAACPCAIYPRFVDGCALLSRCYQDYW